MRKDLVIIPEDHPGVVAELGEALGAAGINIEAISAFTGQGKGIVHILVNEPAQAQKVLADAGFEVRAARDVLVLDIEDTPGALGEKPQTLADAGVNIEQAYLATGTRLVLAVDDTDTARSVLSD